MMAAGTNSRRCTEGVRADKSSSALLSSSLDEPVARIEDILRVIVYIVLKRSHTHSRLTIHRECGTTHSLI